jgi:ribonuclease P protein component
VNQNFKRSKRLLKKDEFQKVKKSINKVRSTYFWGQASDELCHAGSKIGIITTRKLGPAHLRNKSRRIVRELFRKNIGRIKSNTSLIVLPRRNIINADYQTLETEYISFLGKLLILN